MVNDFQSTRQTIVHPLEPIYNYQSKILILESFLSVKTREYGFYYGHPQNRFWPLMSLLLDESLPKNIDEKKDLLLKHGVALYDAIYQCDILGSSDASIQKVIPANLTDIVKETEIQRVFCNGTVSYQCYKKYHAPILKMDAFKLPSTSPANASYLLSKLKQH